MTPTASRLDLPATLSALIRPDTAEPIDVPDDVAQAHRAVATGGGAVEIWFGVPGETAMGELWRRLGWLQGRTSARRPIGFDVTTAADDDGRPVEILVTEPLQGRRATEIEYRVDAVRTIGHVGTALAELHSVPVERCPFVVDAVALAAQARRRIAAHGAGGDLVVDPAVAHVSPERLGEIIADGVERFGRTDDPVLCHGRPTIDRFLLHDGVPVGFDGWNRCGAGDRYLDLAVLARSIATTMTPHLVPVLFDAYGLERPELARLDWFQLVDAVS